MNDDIKQKLKAHIIERVNAEDWKGAMNLLDAITLIAGQSVTITPQVEQVDNPTPPTATDFDNERMQRFNQKSESHGE